MTRRRFEIEKSQFAACPPDAVLDRIVAPQTWPQWQSEIVSVEGPERVSPGDVVRGRARLLGFDVEGHSTSREVGPKTYAEDVIVGVRMQVRYSVARDGDGARITHRLESDLPSGLSGSVLAALLRWRLKKMQKVLLRDLAQQCGHHDNPG